MHLNALYSPNQKKKTILETVKIATEDGYYFKRLILCEMDRINNQNYWNRPGMVKAVSGVGSGGSFSYY